MGRLSKLTDLQWETIGKRLLTGESASSLAREYKISKANISGRFSERVQNVKNVANQIVATERSLSMLNFAEQMAARSLADDLKAVSEHLAGAARFGAMTAHRLSGIAQGKVVKIDDAKPFSDESRKELSDIAALTKMANDASDIGVNLLKANKETIDEQARIALNAGKPSMSPEPVTFRIVRPNGN